MQQQIDIEWEKGTESFKLWKKMNSNKLMEHGGPKQQLTALVHCLLPIEELAVIVLFDFVSINMQDLKIVLALRNTFIDNA